MALSATWVWNKLTWNHQSWPQVYLGWSLRQYLGKTELVTALVSKRGLCGAHRGDRNPKTARVGLRSPIL